MVPENQEVETVAQENHYRELIRQLVVKLAEFIELGILTSLELDVLLDQAQRQYWQDIREQATYRLFDLLRTGSGTAEKLDVLYPSNAIIQLTRQHKLQGTDLVLYKVLESIC